MLSHFEEALETWDDILSMDLENLMHVKEKVKKLQQFIKDYNGGEFCVQEVDDVFVIPMYIENYWEHVLEVTMKAIEYQERLETAYCLV